MRLICIDWCRYRVPFRDCFISDGKSNDFRFGLLLRITTDTGIAGFGEASPIGPADEAGVAHIAKYGSLLREFLIGSVLSDDSSVSDLCNPIAGLPGPLRFGIETALFDLLGKVRGCSVAACLGGKPRKIPVNALIYARLPSTAAEQTRIAVATGFTALKVKVGSGDMAGDIDLLSVIRRVAGPKVTIRIDANQMWTVEQAVATIKRLEQFGLEYVEQPVSADDLSGLCEVRRRVATPIAVDESLATLDDFHHLIQMDAADIFVVKPARTGLLGAVDIISLANRIAKPVVVSSALELDVGVLASVHLASAFGLVRYANGLATLPMLGRTLSSNRHGVSGGKMHCPAEPGLGVSIDETILKKFGTLMNGYISL